MSQNKQLDRRQNEKVLNVLNEINNLYISSKAPIVLQLLGGWVLKEKNEGVSRESIKASMGKRRWALDYLDDRGIIKITKGPLSDGSKSKFILKVSDKTKFDKFYKSCRKSYKEKAAAYQSSKAKENKPNKNNVDLKKSGNYFEEGKYGFLDIDGDKFKLSSKNARISKLAKFLWNPDYFGSAVVIEVIFENIQIKKDANNSLLRNPITRKTEIRNIIKNTQKEIFY